MDTTDAYPATVRRAPLLVIDSWRKLTALVLAVLLVGSLGAAGTRMYFHHADQHLRAEQFEQAQRQFNDQVAQALRSLTLRSAGAPNGAQ